MKYIIVMIMMLASSYALGQGVQLYNGIVSGSPDTTFHAKNKIYKIGGSEFLLGTYDRDAGAIYGVYLRSIEHFPYDSLDKRNLLLDSIKVEFVKEYDNYVLDRSDGYIPFLPGSETFTIYAWKDKQRIILLSIFGRKDETNIIKIEIYDQNMLR